MKSSHPNKSEKRIHLRNKVGGDTIKTILEHSYFVFIIQPSYTHLKKESLTYIEHQNNKSYLFWIPEQEN